MPAVLEAAVPPPHLHHLAITKSLWSSLKCPYSSPPSLLTMSPESLNSYLPHLHDNQVSAENIGGASGWFGPSVPAPGQNEPIYVSYGYDHPYVAPHTSSIAFSPPPQYRKTTAASGSFANDPALAAFSPGSDHSHMSDHAEPEFNRSAEDSYPRIKAEPSEHLQAGISPPTRPRSSPSTFTPKPTPAAPIDFNWTMNPLGISTPNMHEQYYSGSSYPSVRSRSPRFSESAKGLHTDIASPQPRRMYTPIAPHPIGTPQRTTVPKRPRDDDELSEQSKRRKRSDSNTSRTISNPIGPIELGEEDKLLIKLKDEESMPWKDIAARFQSDLGKTYQIPALQMRLKRLRERIRVWSGTDVKALRMAHEYWVQSKFDIISQKMIEFGAEEKWTARQCSRKWAEIDPGPTPYSNSSYDNRSTPTYVPYRTVSPAEAPSFVPYRHIS